jgi:hypothetical protein
LVLFLFAYLFLQCWGLNPGPWACLGSALPLNYIPVQPIVLILDPAFTHI